jgi:hypothetical protein
VREIPSLLELLVRPVDEEKRDAHCTMGLAWSWRGRGARVARLAGVHV